jgi:hypothetical protein
MLLNEFMTTGMFPVNYSGKIAGKKKFNRNYSALSVSLLDLVSVLIRGSNRCGVLVLGMKM